MKWKGFQRDQPDAASPSSTEPCATCSDSLQSRTLEEEDLPSQVSPPVIHTPEPLLSAKDIEALIEEDERQRAEEVISDSGSHRSQPMFLEGASSLDHSDDVWPIIGLPAPPRASRKPVGTAPERSSAARNMALARENLSSASDCHDDLTGAALTPTDARINTDVLRTDKSSSLTQGLHEPGPVPVKTNIEQDSSMSQKVIVDGTRSYAVHTSSFVSEQHTESDSLDVTSKTRALLFHARSNSQDSSFTFSSHEPASSSYEPRISISSTIYPSSAYVSITSQIVPNEAVYDQGQNNAKPQIEIISARTSQASIPSTAPSTHPSRQLATLTIPQSVSTSLPLDVSPIDFAASDQLYGMDSLVDAPPRIASPSKPPVPTAPKPNFKRNKSSQFAVKDVKSSSNATSKLTSRIPYNLLTSLSNSDNGMPLPPTTNNLDPVDRAELIRKTRKLAQVLGQTPSPISGTDDDHLDSPIMHNCLLPMMPTRKSHLRGAPSFSDNLQTPSTLRPSRERWSSSPRPVTGEPSPNLSPITFRSSYFWRDGDADDANSSIDSPIALTPRSPRAKSDGTIVKSPAVMTAESFIDFGETHSERRSSTISYDESINEDEKAEEERRRKRERLAKLHRFLGARVPPELILAPHEMKVPLPALADERYDSSQAQSEGEEPNSSKPWRPGRRRNSLATSSPSNWLSDTDRMKSELNGEQKALIVKRALKMEKWFGEQPPQDLYHTHRTVSASRLAVRSTEVAISAPSSPVVRNINRSAYRKVKYPKQNDTRPGTGDSSKVLLGPTDVNRDDDSRELSHYSGDREASAIYLHYRHSLISLADIVNRDDRESLAELHEYLNEEIQIKAEEMQPSRVLELSSDTTTSKADRRRSLPLKPSLTSLVSVATEVRPEVSPFEVRRRRAAKLSQFFGVGYKDLFGEVLESIEMGVREDSGNGTLDPEEVQDLLARLRKLKKRKDDLQ